MAASQSFEYTLLPDPDAWIRLLVLLPGSSNDPLCQLYGELTCYPREVAPAYNPVSYCWGQEAASSTIYLRNHGQSEWSHLAIRPNLESLLRQLRGSLGSSPVWVDAVCINQDSEAREKGHQVRNMDKVYRQRDLIVWLGEADRHSDFVMDLLGAVSLTDDKHARSLLSQVDPGGLEAIFAFLSRPWFSRRWIVQELVLSSEAVIWIENKRRDFAALRLLYEVLEAQLAQHRDGSDWHNFCTFDPENRHFMPSSELDPLMGFRRLLWTHQAVQDHSLERLTLERLLDNFAGFSSADPRDGIYAFISLASDVDELAWLPRYSGDVNTSMIYMMAVFHVVQRSGSLDIICRSNHGFRSGRNHEPDLPSWVPYFGPQVIDWDSGATTDNKDENETSFDEAPSSERPREHVHHIYGCKALSLTTFGMPIMTTSLRLGEAQRQELFQKPAGCSWCQQDIYGAPFICQDCPGLLCCSRCISGREDLHAPDHHFRSTSGRIYSASGGYLDVTDVSLQDSTGLQELVVVDGAKYHGFIVDTISKFTKYTGEITRCIDNSGLLDAPGLVWLNVAGMDAYTKKVNSARIISPRFFRTMVGNRMVVDGEALLPSEAWMNRATDFLFSNFCWTAGDREKVVDWTAAPQGLLTALNVMITSRAVGRTSERSAMGFFPYDAKPEDSVAILMGCSVPVVLRHMQTNEGEKVYTIIGECYVDGIMEGEYMYEVKENGIERNLLLIK